MKTNQPIELEASILAESNSTGGVTITIPFRSRHFRQRDRLRLQGTLLRLRGSVYSVENSDMYCHQDHRETQRLQLFCRAV